MRPSFRTALSLVASALLAPTAHAQSCPGDINNDGAVNGGDLATVLSSWGGCPVSAPTISQVTPNSGPSAGGTVFFIGGENLNRATSVTVGGVAATILAAHPKVIVATTGASSSLGAKTVAVTTAGGTASASNAFTYTVVAPSWATLIEALPDPAIVTNATLRAAIAATGYAWRVRDNATNIEMVLIPPGSFNMGCSASNQYGCDSDESPIHAVTLTNAYYMGRYEVTQAQWTARMGSNPSQFQSASPEVPAAQVPNRPVEKVSWNTIQGFLSATGMRLPTEAEWEYAYRAGTTTAFHGWPAQTAGTNDDTQVGNIAWFHTGSCDEGAMCQTRPVGGKAPNGFGLHDMAGNVREWVNDWYSSSYYASSPSTNPSGPPTGADHVLRGGSWFNVTNSLRSSDRSTSGTPGNTVGGLGFRVARNP
jgi:formylglycine-generating enzyme required for sulfatase activity